MLQPCCNNSYISGILYTVWFKNSTGRKRKIAITNTIDMAFKEINSFLKQNNYIPPYLRAWKIDDNTIKVDVGSHTRFFHIKDSYKNK